MGLYLLKLTKVAIIAVLTLFLTQVIIAQTDSSMQQSELRRKREELQKQQAELQRQLIELQKQQVELQRQQVERISELQKQQAERLKEQTERQKERAKQQVARMAELQKQQAEWLKEQTMRQKEREKQQTARMAELQKQQAVRLKEQTVRQIEREKRMVELQKLHGGLIWNPEGGLIWNPEGAALSEYEIEIKKEYPVSASPSLSISNMFGNIRIIEGANETIVFNINITGKGGNKDEAKKYAESADVNFNQTGNSITAKTIFKEIQCNNCGRNVNYEVTVPKNTKLVFENKYGNITIDNAISSLDVRLEFGKLFANELSEAIFSIQYGGATFNKCKNLNIMSSFSRYEIGIVDVMTGSISYDGFIINELGDAIVKSDFSNMDIGRLRQSFEAEKFSFGSLKIGHVDERFTNIKVDAQFTSVKVGLTEEHNFKTLLYNNVGSIKTGNAVFYEKSMDKKDVVAGIAGSLKEPTATVEISNSYGIIVFE